MSYLGERTSEEEGKAGVKFVRQEHSQLVGGTGWREAWLGRGQQEREAPREQRFYLFCLAGGRSTVSIG